MISFSWPRWLLPTLVAAALVHLVYLWFLFRLVYFALSHTSLWDDRAGDGHPRRRLRTPLAAVAILTPIQVAVPAYWQIFDLYFIDRIIVSAGFFFVLLHALVVAKPRCDAFALDLEVHDRDAVSSDASSLSPSSPYRAAVDAPSPSRASAAVRVAYYLLGYSPIALCLVGTALFSLAGWQPIWLFLLASGVAVAVFDVARWGFRQISPQATRWWLGAAAASLLLAGAAVPIADWESRWGTMVGGSLVAFFALFALLLAAVAPSAGRGRRRSGPSVEEVSSDQPSRADVPSDVKEQAS